MSDTRAERAPNPDLAGALQEAERALRAITEVRLDTKLTSEQACHKARIRMREVALAALSAAAAPSGPNEQAETGDGHSPSSGGEPDVDVVTVWLALRALNEASEGWPEDNQYERAFKASLPAMKRIENGRRASGERDAGPQPPETT